MSSQSSLLLIDDDPDILMTLTAYLEDSGYQVYGAKDGESGVELFAHCNPDIVVTDLRMPKLDGYGVITAIKARSPQTPIIALTGTGDYHVAGQVTALGAWGCLYKPLNDLNDLVLAIETALEQASRGGAP